MYGEIYKITNKTTQKIYIGQAKKYTGKFDKPWGTEGRWKSHIYEATSGKDHCALLNNAIRKYGENDFLIEKICDSNSESEMNENEKYYINLYQSLSPNGYNLTSGGDSGTDSITTKEKKKNSHIGLKHTENTKLNIGKGQLGNRRNIKARKHPDDKNLPKYITSTRINNILYGYSISKFPIGVEEKGYITEYFKIGGYETSDLCLQAAINRLNELKTKYSYVNTEIATKKEEEIKKKIITKKTEIPLDKLPKYVYPVYHPETKNKIGYYVDGVPDNNGNAYPKKIFTEKKTNKWNLNQANVYINECEVKNQDELFVIPYTFEKSRNECEVKNQDELFVIPYTFEKSRQRKYTGDDNNLPKYVSLIRQNGEKIGYNIAIPSIIKPNGKKYTKKFADKKKSMQEKLRTCIETLEKVKLEYNITS